MIIFFVAIPSVGANINSLIKSHLGSSKWLVNLDFSCSRMCYVIHDIHSVRSSSVHVNNYILVKTFSEKALINFSHHYWMPLQCTLVKHGSRPPQFTRVMKEPSCARMCIGHYHIWIVVPSWCTSVSKKCLLIISFIIRFKYWTRSWFANKCSSHEEVWF